MRTWGGLLLLMLLVLAHAQKERKKKEKKELQDGRFFMKLMNSYDRSALPRKDKPTEVKIGVYINSIYAISQKNMDYSVSFYLRQAWIDPRLAYQPEYPGQTRRAPQGIWEQIWTPDVFFRNEKSARYIDILTPQRLVKFNSSGSVWYVTKYAATLSCQMKLQRFPFDIQTCSIMFESFGYTMDSMYFTWLKNPVEVDPDVELPEFQLNDIILIDCSQNYTSGAFPCLEARLVLERSIGFYVIQVFVPSIVLVFMSWTQFWLEQRAVTGRVLVGLFCSFTLVAQMTGLRSSLPAISYLTSLDVWLLTCLLFTASTLLHLAALASVIKRQAAHEVGGDSSKSGPVVCRSAEKMDLVASIAYPIVFCFFCIVYFALYATPIN